MSMLAEVRRLASRPTLLTAEKRAEQERTKTELSDRAARLQHERTSFLGIEKKAADVLEGNVADLNKEIRSIEVSLARAQRVEQLSELAMGIPLEPLRWRDKRGYPKLVLFSLDQPMFRIWARSRPSAAGTDLPVLYASLDKCYEDVGRLVARKLFWRPWRQDLSLSCSFEGLIPAATKAKIESFSTLVGKSCFHRIYVLAEAANWQLNHTVLLPAGDPLIVFHDAELDPERLWLVAEFDATPVEKMIADLAR